MGRLDRGPILGALLAGGLLYGRGALMGDHFRGVKSHTWAPVRACFCLEVASLWVSREEGTVLSESSPRHLTSILVMVLLIYLLILTPFLTTSFLITLIYFSWAHPKLMKPRDRIGSLKNFSKEVNCRPSLF